MRKDSGRSKGLGTSPKTPAAQSAKAQRPIKPVISAARKAAFQILMAVERGQSHSDDLLRGKAVNSLSAPDRNLATALVLGVLRWQIQLDHQLQILLKRPNAKLDPEVRIALRLGAFQLLHMDRIPARAAIDESVELAKQAGHKFASGMVNAVLRKLGSSSFDFSEGTAAELAMAQAHPVWLVERWVNNFGLEAARALCRHGQTQPALTLRIENPAVETELAADRHCTRTRRTAHRSPHRDFRRPDRQRQPFARAACAFRMKARNWSPNWPALPARIQSITSEKSSTPAPPPAARR